MKSKITIKTWLDLQDVMSKLKRLNIHLRMFGMVEVTDQSNCYAYKALVEDKKDVFGFTHDLVDRDICALALAITQEEQNDYIGHDQIATVNDFFQFVEPITYEDVQNFNSKYI